jgi:hypothetical protein
MSMSISLAGNWKYCLEDRTEFSEPDWDASAWESMPIPGNWFLNGLDHHGVVWYRYEFRCKRKTPYASLHFDGVDYFAEVHLNGKKLGSHAGYFEPFSFDVSEGLRNGKNLLAVRVDSPYEQPGLDGWHIKKRLVKGVLNHHDCRPGGGWETSGQSFNTGGIWNRVVVEETGALTIDRLQLQADLSPSPAVLHVDLTVNNRGKARKARLEVRLTADNFKGKPQTAKFPLELPAGTSRQSFDLPVKDVALWQPWDRGFPHLYRVEANLSSGKENAQAVSSFGFRSVEMAAGFHWKVNGEVYFPRGSNYISTQWLSEALFPEVAGGKRHPFGGGPAGERFLRDVELAKQANLNFLRVHAHVLPPEFHAACDRAGMLVWQDFALQWGYADEKPIQAEIVRQAEAMVALLYNHPSIAAWCCHNESPWDAPWMAGAVGGLYDPAHNRDLDEKLEKAIRSLDPGRVVHRNSGTGDGHTYPGWYFSHWREYQNLPAAPFVTEYGAQALPVRQSMLRMLPQYKEDAGYGELVRLKSWIESVRKIPASTKALMKWGTRLWNFTEKTASLNWLHEKFQAWAMRKGMNTERSIYQRLPAEEQTPAELKGARQVWTDWQFHDFQPMETFEMGIAPGNSLDEFIRNSQAYQAQLIQFATETYRRAKHCPQTKDRETTITGLFQFDFTDPWPAVTWSVLDYWRSPKSGYDALRRSMQPVLPSFRLPEKIEAGKAALTIFQAVNDLTESFPGASCEWSLSDKEGDVASASFPIDIPANGISNEVRLTLPSLVPGEFQFRVSLTHGRRVLGENLYELNVQPPVVKENRK